MKKLAIILAIVIVASITGIGILISQKNQADTDINNLEAKLLESQKEFDTTSTDAKAKADALTSQVESLTTQLETAKADALKDETEAKVKADELTSQVETLIIDLENAKADALKDETGAKVKADELTSQVETLIIDLENAKADASKAETESKAKVDELISQVETLTTQLETAKADALKAATEAKAKADELTSQVETLTSQLETAKADALMAATEAKANADELTSQVETLTTQLETAKADALKAETEAKVKTDELTSQVETLTTQLETAKAEALKAETEAKANADELTSQVEALTTQLETVKADALKAETEAKANADELTSQIETLTTQLETAKADALKAETEAKANADEMTSQIETLTTQLETAKADAFKAETEAKATTDELTSQVETLTTKLETAKADVIKTDAKAKARENELTSQVETLTTQLEATKADALKAETEAKAITDELKNLYSTLNAKPSMLSTADKAKAAIWHTFTKGQEEYLAKAVASFNASQDKYEIELLSQPYDGFLDSVKNSVIAGVGPDIIFNYASEAASYVKGGYLADLSQYIYGEEIGIKDFEGSLVDGIMNGEVKAFEDGGIHYLPAYTTGPIFFYNKTLFDDLKIAVPTTWEEMEAAAKTIKEQKGIAALGCDSLTDLVQMFIMETPGAGYIDVANKAVLFDTPEVRAKIQWLVDMVKNGYFLVKSTGNYFSEDFNAGIVASYIGSSAGSPYITPADGKFEFAMAPVPAATWYPSWNRGPIVFYYKDDARAQAAYEFVKYFISADVNAGWVEAVTALAPYTWTKETDAYKAYVAQDTLAAQALNAVAENLDVAGSLPAVEGANVVRNALKAAIEKAALGDMTVDEAWTEAVTVSNAALQGK